MRSTSGWRIAGKCRCAHQGNLRHSSPKHGQRWWEMNALNSSLTVVTSNFVKMLTSSNTRHVRICLSVCWLCSLEFSLHFHQGYPRLKGKKVNQTSCCAWIECLLLKESTTSGSNQRRLKFNLIQDSPLFHYIFAQTWTIAVQRPEMDM